MTADTAELVPGTNVRRVQREQPGPGGRGHLPITITEAVTETTDVTPEQLEAMLRVLLTFAARNAADLPVALGGKITAAHIADALTEARAARAALEYRVDSLTAELEAVNSGARLEIAALRKRVNTANTATSRIAWLHHRGDLYPESEYDYDADPDVQLAHEAAGDGPVFCDHCGQLWPCATFRALQDIPDPDPDVDIPDPPAQINAAFTWPGPDGMPLGDDATIYTTTYTLRGRPNARTAVYRSGDSARTLSSFWDGAAWTPAATFEAEETGS